MTVTSHSVEDGSRPCEKRAPRRARGEAEASMASRRRTRLQALRVSVQHRGGLKPLALWEEREETGTSEGTQTGILRNGQVAVTAAPRGPGGSAHASVGTDLF